MPPFRELVGPPKEEPPPSEKYVGADPYAYRPPRRVRPKPVPEIVVLPPSHPLAASPLRTPRPQTVTVQPVPPTIGDVSAEYVGR